MTTLFEMVLLSLLLSLTNDLLKPNRNLVFISRFIIFQRLDENSETVSFQLTKLLKLPLAKAFVSHILAISFTEILKI